MVHALEECWRVLVPEGQLIDMRPRANNPDVELVLANSTLIAGQIDDSASEIDYAAADRAMAGVVAQGLFAKREARLFTFAYYWQTPDEMQAYIEEVWSSYNILPPAVVQRACQLTPVDQAVQYRVQEAIEIIDYRKRPARRRSAQ